ncbi:MAG: thioredoxin family protein [Chitinispirillaceae bacterium]|nr:thioredoxin family protein [Chitinispirillaceae bacterium]
MTNQLKTIVVFLLLLSLNAAAQLQLSGELTPSQQPVKEPVTLTISRNTPISKDTLSITLTLRMEKNIHIYSAESLFFKISIPDTSGLGKGTIELPKPKSFVNFDKSTVSVYVGGQKIIIRHPVAAPDWSLAGTIHFQACDSNMCFFPQEIAFSAKSDGTLSAGSGAPGAPSTQTISGTPPVDVMQLLEDFTVVGSRGGFLNVGRFSEFLREPAAKGSGRSGGFEDKGFLLVILLILLGGIALNLTPCVLPMIPITIAVIGAGSQAKSRGRGMFVGAVYGSAMALTYGALGLFVVLTGAQFGVINSSPLFNIMIALVFILMALAMFDIIQIDFTRFRKTSGPPSERGRLLTVFIMGIVASLLAGACVAPVVISVVLYAGTLYGNGNMAGMVLPFLLGIGMALPWPFAGAGLSFLPKPGKWMVWIKYVFGIFILAMAIYYGYTGVTLFRGGSAPKTAPAKAAPSALPWLHSLEEGLQKAKAENKPVFIDFWATWCKNCKAMDATTFRDPGVEELLKGYILIKYQAEKPDEPSIKKLLDRFGVVGLPTYVVVKGK